MGHRLSKITTRTGDAGQTGLGDGARVDKDDPRIVALGDVDELNSMLGLLSAEPLAEDIAEAVLLIQNHLFDLGGELSIPGYRLVTADHVSRIEALVEHFNADLPPLKEFILPGGSRAAAVAHLARTICRRAERAVVTLARDQAVSSETRIYLNRLSDLLFILGRVLNVRANCGDVLWKKPSPPA
jgi:cob(I)alamin adenosyltransferase